LAEASVNNQFTIFGGTANPALVRAIARELDTSGELNVGQLARQKYKYAADAVLVGFTTYHGAVMAASDWGKSAERKRVRPALASSYEALFHAAGRDRFLLIMNDSDGVTQQLRAVRLERAIGVIYRPETERQSHYFRARLPDQFDAVLHFDETRAVKPLETAEEWETGELPETFPFAV
jgi:erythromycin esterase-like protein